MTLALAVVIGLSVVGAIVRLVLRWVRRPVAARSTLWRIVVLVAAQPLSGGLLYLALTTTSEPTGGTLIVATHGSSRLALASGDRAVALPEAPPWSGVDRVPDLATALRRFRPDRLRILGDGLTARDRDGVVGLAIDFTPAPPPQGIIRLDPPRAVAAGGRVGISGRVGGMGAFVVDLIDPAGRRVDTATPDAAGDFVVTGTTRIAGPAVFTLRVRVAAKVIEEAAVSIWVDPATPLRLLLLAGAPGPEVKYLRRWASDAGLVVHSEVATGAGLVLGDAPLPMNVATLARFDIAVVDARRWAGLSVAERGSFVTAVRDGLGLLVRIDEPLSEPVRVALRPLGFVVAGGGDSVAVSLASTGDATTQVARSGPGTRDAPTVVDPGSGATSLTVWRLALTSPTTTPLLRDSRAAAIGGWRAVGQGRAGLWPLVDSYRLVLAGRGDSYGELWSAALTTLGRPKSQAAPTITYTARVGNRTTLCGIGPDAGIIAPDGRSTKLLIDPVTGRDCAAFWPTTVGWHELRQSGAPDGQRFVVAERGALPNAAALADRTATIDLVWASVCPAGGATQRWPVATSWWWFAAWLIVMATLWWFERTRRGVSPAMTARDAMVDAPGFEPGTR
jgi:hypothetical protein